MDAPSLIHRVTHNDVDAEYDKDIPGLKQASKSLMKGPPIRLEIAHANALLVQFQETAGIRGWELRAVAIMFNHFHIVVGVPGDPEPSKILGDFKAWATRCLSKQFGAPASETWWTERGSKRKLRNDEAVIGAIQYVLYEQPNPLLRWSPETGLLI
jgi:REP element-mobilizing transposase RayT